MNISKKKSHQLVLSMNCINHIHLIGIGGISMSGIAEILLLYGYKISGSDLKSTRITRRLSTLGAKVFLNHSKEHIKNVDVSIISSAILKTNPEVIQSKILNIPIISRGEMLSEITRYKYTIAISGTHGKTTVTAMTFSMFLKGNLDPTIINGGYTKEIQNTIKLGNSPYHIIEADESDASFLYLRPIIAVITNIDDDHLENYHGKFENLKLAFIKFIQNLPFYGIAIVCIDNKNTRNIIPLIRCNVITYGFNLQSDVRINKYKQKKFLSYFTIIRKNRPKLNVILNVPGKHNALNATAAVAIATKKNISDIDILKSLKNFQGVERRFESCGKFLIKNPLFKNNILTIIKDYGHHPNEICFSIKTAKSGWPRKKLIMIFQPHRYTRTHYLFKKFIKVLLKVDELIILKEYPANEIKIPGSDSISLYTKISQYKGKSITLISHYQNVFFALLKKISGNDLILIQGAGNINTIIENYIIKNLKKINKK
ncbi:MAG: UDP-N-acetylmuramate--L-alanine ligase [Buchnera aphidicola (Nurudea ibofushi)]